MEPDDFKINDYIKRIFDRPDIGHDFGWYGLTLPILEEIRLYNEKHPDKKILVRQIKQKWGRLVIYTTDRPEYLDKMILKAGYESTHICEICGAAGKLVDVYGCFKTVCEEHLQARLKSIKSDKSEDQLYKELLDEKQYVTNDCLKIHELEEKNEE